MTRKRPHIGRPSAPQGAGSRGLPLGGWRGWLCAALLSLTGLASTAQAQIPTVLTDKIYQGSGTINLLKDVSAEALQAYLKQNSGALLGVDLNENPVGNETKDSVGLAIKNVELVLTTTTGTTTFRDFYTSTTAKITEAGSAAPQEYYTLFGRSGSSSLNGGTSDFDPSRLEDVLEIRNVAFSGTLVGAQLKVTFLQTATSKADNNESFFDFSSGPEDFALIDQATAQVIEKAAAGLATAPSSIAFTTEPIASNSPTPVAPGAPSPPLTVLALLGGIIAWKAHSRG